MPGNPTTPHNIAEAKGATKANVERSSPPPGRHPAPATGRGSGSAETRAALDDLPAPARPFAATLPEHMLCVDVWGSPSRSCQIPAQIGHTKADRSTFFEFGVGLGVKSANLGRDRPKLVTCGPRLVKIRSKSPHSGRCCVKCGQYQAKRATLVECRPNSATIGPRTERTQATTCESRPSKARRSPNLGMKSTERARFTSMLVQW